MPRYRVMNRTTHETYEIDAPCAQLACERLGWMIGYCYVKQLPASFPQEITRVSPLVAEKNNRHK